MKRLSVAVLAVTLLTGVAVAQELIINGDFEQGLEVGWTEEVRPLAGTWLFERSDTCGQPQPGFIARVRKDLGTSAALVQTVVVPSVNLTFSYTGRFRIGGGSSTCWPAAALILRYLDSANVELGNSKCVLHNEYCSWANSDTAHIIEIELPEVWAGHNLDIAREITDNLPGVNASQVTKIRVELFAYDNGT